MPRATHILFLVRRRVAGVSGKSQVFWNPAFYVRGLTGVAFSMPLCVVDFVGRQGHLSKGAPLLKYSPFLRRSNSRERGARIQKYEVTGRIARSVVFQITLKTVK